MTIIRLLATVSIVALAVTVAAPATKSAKAVGSPAKTVKVVTPSAHKVIRRAKRSVIVQVPLEVDDEAVEQNELEAELSQLSDEQLEILAEVVQNELDRYDPQIPLEQYEIVDIPIEYLTPRRYPRNRRSVPTALIGDEEEEVIFVPEEVLQEALEEEALEEAAEEELAKELDEMELRVRIGEMADILNERASRRSRR